MEGKRCPYCGRRISYFTTFHEKKRGLHTCPRCNKECKIKTDLRLVLGFAAVALLVVMFMIIWNNSQNYNNFLGVVIVAAVLILFYFLTPLFISFVPLKKYYNNPYEREYENEGEENEDGDYVFDRDAFNEVKKNRKPRHTPNEKTMVREVPIIKDVSEAHASSSDAPLKKVTHIEKTIFDDEPEVEFREEVKTYVPKKKPNGQKYTANRKL